MNGDRKASIHGRRNQSRQAEGTLYVFVQEGISSQFSPVNYRRQRSDDLNHTAVAARRIPSLVMRIPTGKITLL